MFKFFSNLLLVHLFTNASRLFISSFAFPGNPALFSENQPHHNPFLPSIYGVMPVPASTGCLRPFDFLTPEEASLLSGGSADYLGAMFSSRRCRRSRTVFTDGQLKGLEKKLVKLNFRITMNLQQLI